MTSKTTLSALTLAAILGVAAYSAFPAGAQEGEAAMGMTMGMGRGAEVPTFDTLDADKDGKVTPAEIAAQRKASVLGSDANGDGKLSAEELTTQQVTDITAKATERSARMILILDVDGDGLLSAEELAAGPGQMRMFDRMDADGDGAITKAEADAAAEQMQGRGRDEGRGPGGKGDCHDGGHGGKGGGMGHGPEADDGSN